MRVLITNLVCWPRSGSVLYVRDLALELQRQGHTPEVFCLPQGEIVAELREAGIPVEANWRKLRHRPDVIHGHHYAPTLVAVRHWRNVPAINICHDFKAPDDRAPFHPSIRLYFGMGGLSVRRYLNEGVAEADVTLLHNFVDLTRFAPRQNLPARPRRALVFSNYAREGSQRNALREACDGAGLQLGVAGAGVGKSVADPERILPEYDIICAKAKAAMEWRSAPRSFCATTVESARWSHLKTLMNCGHSTLVSRRCASR